MFSRFLTVFSFLILSSLSLHATPQDSTFVSHSGHIITFHWPDPKDDVSEAMTVLYHSFLKTYEPTSKEELKITFDSKEEWLKETFEEEEQDFKNQKTPIWLIEAKEGDQVIGAALLEPNDGTSTTTLYIRQMAIRPDYWREGIGTGMMKDIEKNFSNFTEIALLARIVNSGAKGFYSRLGFIEGGYMHPKYEGKPYLGFKKILKKEE
jgi:ribosomal protein S18 acetylase RimI-like enzyme